MVLNVQTRTLFTWKALIKALMNVFVHNNTITVRESSRTFGLELPECLSKRFVQETELC